MSSAMLPPPSGPLLSPTPSDEEAVVIMAAMEALWPTPLVLTTDAIPVRSTSWRFSGRWWSTPLPVRRGRPYR